MQIARESIFVSAIRSLINAFFAVIGVLIGVVVLLALSTISLSKKNDFGEPGKTKIRLVPNGEGNRSLLPDSAPVILKLNVHGVIGSEKLNSHAIESILLSSREGILSGDRVKGIFVDMNTPGGAADDSDEIYQMLMDYKEQYKVPIYTYVRSLCASGGMIVACATDKIISSPNGIIGSVGVISGPYFNFSKAMANWGVAAKTFTDGKDKDLMNPTRPWKADEGQDLENIIRSSYKQFVNLVVKHRPRIDRVKLVNDYGASVFDPETAEEYGYIDEANVTYRTALKEFAKACNIEDEYQVVEISHYPSLAAQLIESSFLKGTIKHEFSNGMNNQSKLLYLYQ
ncbi:MAG: S49 family peptidase [Simkaniaceae bacterium]|nr:S49 family peptidase [Simkaniaceae bacterium]